MLTAQELYEKLQNLKENGHNLSDINLLVESSENDEEFWLMPKIDWDAGFKNLKISFHDDREGEKDGYKKRK